MERQRTKTGYQVALGRLSMVVALLLLVAPGAPDARAEEEKSIATTMYRSAAAMGNVKRAAQVLEAEYTAEELKKADVFFDIARTSYIYAFRFARDDDSNADDALKLGAALFKLAESHMAAEDKDYKPYHALAYVHAFKGRLLRALDHDWDDSHVESAIKVLNDAIKADPTNEATTRILSSYLMGNAVGLDDPDRLKWVKRAVGELEPLVAKGSASESVVLGLVRLRMQSADAMMAAKDKRGAKKSIEQAWTEMTTLPERVRKTTAGAFAWNQLLSWGKAVKAKCKGEYLSKEVRGFGGNFGFQLPLGGHWEREPMAGDQLLDQITRQVGDETVTILVGKYDWDTNYTGDFGRAGGDNPSGLAAMDRDRELAGMQKVIRKRKKIAGRLNKQIKKTSGFELQGYDGSGTYILVRTWYFKAEHRKATYFVDLRITGGTRPRIDDEIEFFLDNIEERDHRKRR